MKRFSMILGILLVLFVGSIACVLFYVKFPPTFEITAERTSLRNDEIFGWIEQIVSFGPRKPATQGDERTRAFITERFAEFGLELAEPEPVDVETSRVRTWRFSLKDRSSGEELVVPTFHIPFPAPTPEEEVEAEPAYVGDGDDIDRMDLNGKIVVFEQPAKTINIDLQKKLFFFYDPAGSIPKGYRPSSLEAMKERQIHDKVVAKGAMGMVGLLSQLQWESDTFCPQMNHGVSKRIPGYWVSPKNARVLREWLARENVVGKMTMGAELGRSVTYNVWATLSGKRDEYYIVMGHHDAPFANAVQDASGVSVVLALAKHFSAVRQERPLERGIIFLTVGGHTLGRLGERAFVERHRNNLLPKTALVVSVEHIAREFVPGEDLSFTCAGDPALRMFVTSGKRSIDGIVKSSILQNDYRRSVLIPQWIVKRTTGKARGISGEFYEAGVPVIGLLPNPPYMFFKEDTPATVARDQLAPTTDLIISMLRTADTLPMDRFR